MKPRIAVLFGGRSPEHWISFKSGLFVLIFLDRDAYDVDAVYVRQDGTFASADVYLQTLDRFLAENRVVIFKDEDNVGDWRGRLEASASALSEDFLLAAAGKAWNLVFPVFHGRFGEDGTIQGLAKTLGIPCAGCSFQASSMGMDKILTKQIAEAAGLAVAPYRLVRSHDWAQRPDSLAGDIPRALGLPLFVKPARLGSSIGVSRATTEASLRSALDLAFQYDVRAIVEAEVRSSEYAVGVLGDRDRATTSVVAEYTSNPENFDYDSKYGPSSLDDIIPSNLSPADTTVMLDFVRAAFSALKIRGICRIDCFRGPDGPILNEVNTMPGLNALSPFIRAWGAAGVTKRELLDRIVALGLGKS